MPRVLAIDYGAKRSGLAVTDPMKIIACPLAGVRTCDLMDFLKDYIEREQVESVVLGYPLNNDRKPTGNTPPVEAFANRFKKTFPQVPVVLHDESFTSKMAVSSMVAAGTKKKNRRKKLHVDQVSATIILQSFMETGT